MHFDSFHFSSPRVLVLVLVLGGGGCDAEATNDYGKQDLHYPDAGKPDVDAAGLSCDGGTGDEGPACELARPAMCNAQVIDACSTPANPCLGTIQGQLVVPDTSMPGGGHPARGTLVIALLESLTGGGDPSCPDGSTSTAPTTTFVAIHCADLTAGKKVDFTLEGVPVGVDRYVVAGLDVNENGVDPCDLLGFTAMPVTVVEPGQTLELENPISLSVSAGFVIDPSCNLICE